MKNILILIIYSLVFCCTKNHEESGGNGVVLPPEFYCKIDGAEYMERYFSGNGLDSVHTARWYKFQNYDSTYAYKILTWIRSNSMPSNYTQTFDFTFDADTIILNKQYNCKNIWAILDSDVWSDGSLQGESPKVTITNFDGNTMSGFYSSMRLVNGSPQHYQHVTMTDGKFTNFPKQQ